jgi:hypothetical protein
LEDSTGILKIWSEADLPAFFVEDLIGELAGQGLIFSNLKMTWTPLFFHS